MSHKEEADAVDRNHRRLSKRKRLKQHFALFSSNSSTASRRTEETARSLDGKAQRGRLKFEEKNDYAVHAVSLVDHRTGIVLSQGHVEKTDVEPKGEPPDVETTSKLTEEQEQEEQEEKKQKSELAVAYRLITHIDWKGKILTGDALYCQRCLCFELRRAGGDYLFIVKGNQPQLFEDIRLLFAQLSPPKRAGEGILRLPEQHAQTTEKAHGRVDIRSIRVSSELKGYSDWPGLEQVFEIRRCWQSKGVWKEAVRYGVTSLPAPIAFPERLLTLKRGHWIIEAQSRKQEMPFLREIPHWQGTRKLFPLASIVFFVKKGGFPERKLVKR